MADQVTATAEKTPEEYEREMERTRESISEKVVALENKVVGTVQHAADTISETVHAVKSLVSTGPEVVSDTVKQAASALNEVMKDSFNVSERVRQHPWAAVGVSSLLGAVLGFLTAPGSGRRGGSEPRGAVAYPPVPPTPAAEKQPGVVDEVVGMMTEKLRELTRTTIESVSAAVKQQIQTGVPQAVDAAASRLTPEPDRPPGLYPTNLRKEPA